MLKQIPLVKLVEDLSLYPRHDVDDVHVSSLVDALQAGCQFPPVVADERSLRLVDGWHRVRAYRRFLSDQAVVDVDVRHYQNDEAILVDAIQRNATHGRKLDRRDQVRCAVMLQERNVGIRVIATALHIPEERAIKLMIRTAYGPQGNPDTIPGTRKIELKRPVLHLAGQELNAEQAAAVESSPGTSYMLVAKQLYDALRTRILKADDDRLVQRLRELHDELGRFLASLPVRTS